MATVKKSAKAPVKKVAPKVMSQQAPPMQQGPPQMSGGAPMMKKGGKMVKKAAKHKMPDGSMMKNSKMKKGGMIKKGC